MRYWILFFTVLQLNSYAQQDTLSAEYKRLLLLRSSRPVVGLEYELGAANNQISFQSIADFASRSFLDDAFKEDMLSKVSNTLDFGYWQTYSFSWHKPSTTILGQYIPGWKFSIVNEFISSASITEDAVALGLFGNKRFEGANADLSDSEYESWWYTSLDYEYEFVADSNFYFVNAALVLGHSYESYAVERANIFTANNGEYIDADLKYDFRSTNNDNSIPFRGLGFSTGFKAVLPLSDDFKLSGGLSNLGLIYWSNGEEAKIDSSFRFQGLTFDNIFEINDSLTQAETDRITDGLYTSKSASFATLLPFRIALRGELATKIWKFNSFYSEIDYRYLTAYSPRFALGANLDFNKKHEFDIGLRYGGFNTFAVPLNYSLNLKSWKLVVGSSNILGAALPAATMGASIYGGLFYEL